MAIYVHDLTLIYDSHHEQAVPTATPVCVVARGRLQGPLQPDEDGPIVRVRFTYSAADNVDYTTEINTNPRDPNASDVFVYRSTNRLDRSDPAYHLGTRDLKLVPARNLRWIFAVLRHEVVARAASSDWADLSWHHPSCQWYSAE